MTDYYKKYIKYKKFYESLKHKSPEELKKIKDKYIKTKELKRKMNLKNQ